MYLLSGIKRDKTMAHKLLYTPLMMIHKITLSVDYNKYLKCFDTEPNKPINQP